ncbi:hypothetical protein PP460_gp097 [Streptomyces phage Muntaha]|uniref:Uncharacterized protein n=1 Tax=Streptomyces phage Muntaha TaxID=2713269 RepID=A0A6G8R3C4_9CAUD|nr:hypothetical protein PP460_gp097 [Streptomyces phage Muntaha]QIN94705.1 hypothetical protein SEA_MUNTAHA_181 [Streptomyces phage Muntaha]
MTVAELIAHLQTLDQNAKVEVTYDDGYGGGELVPSNIYVTEGTVEILAG